jgi:hypothetical protein
MRPKFATLLAIFVMQSLANPAWSQSKPWLAPWVWRTPTPRPTRAPTQPPTPTQTSVPTPTPTSIPPLQPADAFQMRYASNLNVGDSVVNITNAGSADGRNICVNVYTFSPDEQLVSCCSCVVTPNALVSLSARSDLISNTLTPATPNSIVVKLLATSGVACNASLPTAADLAPGMRAWGSTLHASPVAGTYAVTETEFSPAPLSAAELADITGTCGYIQEDGSGFGICRSCRLGGQ